MDSKNNDFPAQSKCSNITEHNIRAMNWIRVSIAVGGFLVMALILAVVLVRREFKTVIDRLFMYVLLATLLREAVLLSNIEHQFKHDSMDQVCSVLGALNLYTTVLVIIFVAATLLYLLSRVVRKKPRSDAFAIMFELAFVILSCLVPLIASVGLLYTDIFGLSTAWCWIKEYDSQCHKTSLKKTLGTSGAVLITVVLSFIMTAVIVIIYCRIALKIKQATLLLKLAAVLITCLILVFATEVIRLTSFYQHIFILYAYTVAISLYDLIYPLGFLVSLKCQAMLSHANKKRRHYTHSPLARSVNATAPPSDRVSDRSTTIAISMLLYTGQFTTIDEEDAI